jgi:diadenosine tetraphosphatase ApaH/serine/threonine PP2A family protein phosphatase
VYGHIHCPYLRRVHSAMVANAGSVSLSYDGDPRASYLVLDDDQAIIRRVSYDMTREARRLADVGYPCADWLATILRTGRYIPPPQFNDAVDCGS